jgi:general secretion pathway protein G
VYPEGIAFAFIPGRMERKAPAKRWRGFTLIELLIVVAVIGIIAAISIPNLLNAMDRSKQKRTMADVRYLATSVETYAIDNTYYPAQASEADSATSSLPTAIGPIYMRNAPTLDGWGYALRYQSDGVAYTVGSRAKDGAVGGTLTLFGTGGPQHDFDCDIVFSYGAFIQWPEGTQQD